MNETIETIYKQVSEPLENLQFPVSYVTILERVAAAKGVDANQLIVQRLHMEPSALSTPNLLMTGQQLWDMLDFANDAAATDAESQRALIESVPLTAHGYVGFAVMSAATLEKVVEEMSKWHQLAMPACEMQYERIGDMCRVRFYRTTSFGKHNALFEELGACVILSMLALSHLDFAMVNLHLEHPALVLDQIGDAHPGLTIKTSSQHTEVLFPADQLDLPIPTANSAMLASMQETLKGQNELFERNRPLTAVVSSLISSALRNGADITASDVASELQLPLRSLSRRLKEEDSSFKALHHQVRIEMAKTILARKDKTVSQVSDLLGFSCEASFSRFFKQRTGQCPTEFKHSVQN